MVRGEEKRTARGEEKGTVKGEGKGRQLIREIDGRKGTRDESK